LNTSYSNSLPNPPAWVRETQKKKTQKSTTEGAHWKERGLKNRDTDIGEREKKVGRERDEQ
jgi:hypothetical protein